MEEIILLLDYKSSFGSKYNSSPPYSGLNLELLSKEMAKNNYQLRQMHFFEIDITQPNKYINVKVLYQSAEANDDCGEYKSHIDDVLYFLTLAGAQLIPDYKYFKAHTNKVFMEMLRSFIHDENKPNNSFYGSFEDFKNNNRKRNFPLVVKKSHGAQSKGVFKADNQKQLEKIVKKITKSKYNLKDYIREKARTLKYADYLPFSIHRNKFIVQSFTEGLAGDFKVLIFHDIIYLVKRDNPPKDFRASGGGYNSFIGEFEIPEGLLEYSMRIYKQFNCPYVSLDIGINTNGFNLIEFQFINFGTSGHSKSKKCIIKSDNKYIVKENIFNIEFLYSYSITNYLK